METQKFVAWDLEIAKEFPPDGAWDGSRLGISCASTETHEGHSHLWYTGGFGEDAPYAAQATSGAVRFLVDYLEQKAGRGYRIITWNGLGFDFRVLAQECESPKYAKLCAELAVDAHIDMAFLQVAQMGYMIGLQTAANALGVEGKTEGVHGDLAPVMWNGMTDATTEAVTDAIKLLGVAPGSRAAQDLCLAYVRQDSHVTAEVYKAILAKPAGFRWTTRKGKRSYRPWVPARTEDGALLTVAEALRLPEPDTSWMSTPRTRASFMEWFSK